MRTSEQNKKASSPVPSFHRVLRRLWHDERGSMSWVGIILSTTVFTLGVLMGLSTLRDHVAQQFGDTAVAIESLNQTWAYFHVIDLNGDGDGNDAGECQFSGFYLDNALPPLSDPADTPPGGMTFVAP